MKLSRTIGKTSIILCALVLMGSARADELKVLTTGILKGAFTTIAAQFEKDTGHKVTMSWGPSSGNSPDASPQRIRSGEHVDVLIMVNTGMDDLVRTGHFVPLERKDVAVSKIGVAVKEGRPLPDISTVSAVRQSLLNAKSIGYSEGASGTYVSTVMLKKLGIADEVAGKSHVILGRKFVGEVVASGEVELGIQQLSELRLESPSWVLCPTNFRTSASFPPRCRRRRRALKQRSGSWHFSQRLLPFRQLGRAGSISPSRRP